MKAPDKIYVPVEYAGTDVLPVGVTMAQVFQGDICYIRKDSLMAWLENYIEVLRNDGKPVHHEAMISICNLIIDKINKL